MLEFEFIRLKFSFACDFLRTVFQQGKKIRSKQRILYDFDRQNLHHRGGASENKSAQILGMRDTWKLVGLGLWAYYAASEVVMLQECEY